MKLFRAIIILLVFTISVDARLILSYAEKRTLNREIIMLDLRIRNSVSMIATGRIGGLMKELLGLSKFHTAHLLRYRRGFNGLQNKLHKTRIIDSFTKLHAKSKALRMYLKKNRRQVDWSFIEKEFAVILQLSREIHQKVKVK